MINILQVSTLKKIFFYLFICQFNLIVSLNKVIDDAKSSVELTKINQLEKRNQNSLFTKLNSNIKSSCSNQIPLIPELQSIVFDYLKTDLPQYIYYKTLKLPNECNVNYFTNVHVIEFNEENDIVLIQDNDYGLNYVFKNKFDYSVGEFAKVKLNPLSLKTICFKNNCKFHLRINDDSSFSVMVSNNSSQIKTDLSACFLSCCCIHNNTFAWINHGQPIIYFIKGDSFAQTNIKLFNNESNYKRYCPTSDIAASPDGKYLAVLLINNLILLYVRKEFDIQ